MSTEPTYCVILSPAMEEALMQATRALLEAADQSDEDNELRPVIGGFVMILSLLMATGLTDMSKAKTATLN